MKRGAKLTLLVLALLLLAGAYAWLLRGNAERAKKEQLAAEATAIPLAAFAGEGITALSYVYSGEAVTLTRTGGVWAFANDLQLPVDQQQAAAMAGALTALNGARSFPAEGGLAQYGLEAPILTVTATAADGRTHTFALGDRSDVTFEYYLTIDGGSTVYLVDASLKNTFSRSVADLAQKDEIPLMTDIRRVAIARANGETHALAYDTDEAIWYALDASGARQVAEADGAERLAARVRALTWRKCVSCALTDAERASFGLDAPARVSVEYAVTTASGGTESEALRTFLFEIGGAANEYYYASLPEGRMAYLIDAALADALLALGGETAEDRAA